MTEEQWRRSSRYPNIEVSNLARVRVTHKRGGGQILEYRASTDGQATVRFHYQSTHGTSHKTQTYVKSLVYRTWISEDVVPLDIKFADNNPFNCHPDNLYIEGPEIPCFKCGEHPGDLTNFGLCEVCSEQ